MPPRPTRPPTVSSGPVAVGDSGEPLGATRAGVVWAVAGLVLLMLMIVFILQNQDPVRIHYLGLVGSLPSGLAVFSAAVGGGSLVAVAAAFRITQLRIIANHVHRRPGCTAVSQGTASAIQSRSPRELSVQAGRGSPALIGFGPVYPPWLERPAGLPISAEPISRLMPGTFARRITVRRTKAEYRVAGTNHCAADRPACWCSSTSGRKRASKDVRATLIPECLDSSSANALAAAIPREAPWPARRDTAAAASPRRTTRPVCQRGILIWATWS